MGMLLMLRADGLRNCQKAQLQIVSGISSNKQRCFTFSRFASVPEWHNDELMLENVKFYFWSYGADAEHCYCNGQGGYTT